MTQWTGYAILTGVCLAATFLGQLSYGQTELPANWQALPAAEFSQATELMFAAQPPATHQYTAQVVKHAWEHFLDQTEFVANENWPTVQKMLAQFSHRRGLLVVGDTDEERAASKQQIETRALALKQRVATRLTNEPVMGTGATFEELLVADNVLRQVGVSDPQRAVLFAQWMDANDWRKATLLHQSHLFAALDAGQVKREQFSARWTGTIKAPATGDYTLEQLRQFSQDASIKIWVNDQLVLDSTPPVVPQSGEETPAIEDRVAAAARYRSQPVPLTAGQAADIRVELVHDVKSMGFRGGYPMAVVLWESDVLQQQIIPLNAFAPPANFDVPVRQGLKGEYFTDTKHQDLKATQLDPGLQMIWNSQGVANAYHNKRKLILDHCWPALTEIPDGERDRIEFVQYVAGRFLSGMPAARRGQLMAQLTSSRQLLKIIWPNLMRELLVYVHMLPGAKYVDLIGAWGNVCEQPRSQIGRYPGWGALWEGYYDRNYGISLDLGSWVSRDFFSYTTRLWDNYLARENGDCNLTVAYMTVFSAKIDDADRELRRRLDQRLANEGLTGDQRMTWLLARGYAEEVLGLRQPRPERGLPFVKEAYLVAQSPEYRFWALQELISRMVSLDQIDEAKSFLDSVKGQFQTPQQQTAMQQWREAADKLSLVYKKVREQEELQGEDNRAYIAELTRRMKGAEKRQDAVEVARYQQRLQSLEEDKPDADR